MPNNISLGELWRQIIESAGGSANADISTMHSILTEFATALAAGGGMVPPWLQYGSGVPTGTVTPYIAGALYMDTSGASGLWFAASTTNTSWVGLNGSTSYGLFANPDGSIGLFSQGNGNFSFLASPASTGVVYAYDTYIGLKVNGYASAIFVYPGSPNSHVTPNEAGDFCLDTSTPAIWQATGAVNTDWVQQAVMGTYLTKGLGTDGGGNWSLSGNGGGKSAVLISGGGLGTGAAVIVEDSTVPLIGFFAGAYTFDWFIYPGNPNTHLTPNNVGDCVVDTSTPGIWQATGLANTDWVGFGAGTFLPLSGGTMSGVIAMGSHKITGLTNGSASSDAAAFGQIPTALPPNGAAGGDLSGTYPNPAVVKINGSPLGTTTGATTGYVLTWNGSAWAPAAAAGGAPTGTTGGDLSGTYPNPVVAQINGSPLGTTTGATTGYGLIWNGSAWAPAAIGSGGAPSGAAGGSLGGTYPNPSIATSVALPGSPTTTTQSALDNSTKVATTAYTDAAVAVETTRAEGVELLKAPLSNPTFSGNPAAPTQTPLNNSTRIATTAYADLAVGVETTRAEAAEALKAPIASPTFTGITSAPEFSASGLTGAIAASRYVGRHDGGAPTTGTFAVGDWVIDVTTPAIWICTSAGTPGAWSNGKTTWDGNLSNSGYPTPGATYTLAGVGLYQLEMLTLTTNLTLSPWASGVAGDLKILRLAQPGSGGTYNYTVTYSGFTAPGGGFPVLSTGQFAYDFVSVLFDGFQYNVMPGAMGYP